MILDQKWALYYQSKRALHQDHNKFMMPLLCLGAFGSTFAWAFFGKFRTQIFKVGKNIAKIGLKKILAVKA
ncbi:MAG: hypothetical protein K0R24_53 [Gammaproteobacteria bacterium]|jgi:hypothetical protein|nr:hypothetical protein [Gammaproteobacteria bacterium]